MVIEAGLGWQMQVSPIVVVQEVLEQDVKAGED